MSAPGDASTVCVANIGPRGIRLRRITGGIGIGLGLIFAVAVVLTDSPRAWRVIAFAPFFTGALGLLLAHEKTCVAFAKRGIRDDDAEPAPAGLDAAAIDAAIAGAAHRIRLRALITAAVLTGLLYAIPPAAR
jgi:hypothetical protein